MSQRVRGRQRASTSGRPRPAPGRQQPETYSKRALFQIAGPRNNFTNRRRGPAGDYCEGQREGRRQRRCGRSYKGLIVANIGTRDFLRARDGGEKVGKGYEHTLSVWCGRDRVEVPAWRLRYARCTMMDARCQRGGSLMDAARWRQLEWICDATAPVLPPPFEPRRVMLLAQTRALCRATGTWAYMGINICEGPMRKHGIPGRALGSLVVTPVWAGVSDGGFPAHKARGQARFRCVDTPHMSELVDSTARPQGWWCFWKVGAVAAAKWRRHLRGKCGCIPIGWQQTRRWPAGRPLQAAELCVRSTSRSTWGLCLLQWPPVRKSALCFHRCPSPLVWFATSLCLLSFCPQLHLTSAKHHHHPPTTPNATTVVSLFPCCLTIDLF
jgi:hypothetical protein